MPIVPNPIPGNQGTDELSARAFLATMQKHFSKPLVPLEHVKSLVQTNVRKIPKTKYCSSPNSFLQNYFSISGFLNFGELIGTHRRL